MHPRLTGREASVAWLLVVGAFAWTAVQTASGLAWVACGVSILMPALAFMVAAHAPARALDRS
jgi:hypothetical protein